MKNQKFNQNCIPTPEQTFNGPNINLTDELINSAASTQDIQNLVHHIKLQTESVLSLQNNITNFRIASGNLQKINANTLALEEKAEQQRKLKSKKRRSHKRSDSLTRYEEPKATNLKVRPKNHSHTTYEQPRQTEISKNTLLNSSQLKNLSTDSDDNSNTSNQLSEDPAEENSQVSDPKPKHSIFVTSETTTLTETTILTNTNTNSTYFEYCNEHPGHLHRTYPSSSHKKASGHHKLKPKHLNSSIKKSSKSNHYNTNSSNPEKLQQLNQKLLKQEQRLLEQKTKQKKAKQQSDNLKLINSEFSPCTVHRKGVLLQKQRIRISSGTAQTHSKLNTSTVNSRPSSSLQNLININKNLPPYSAVTSRAASPQNTSFPEHQRNHSSNFYTPRSYHKSNLKPNNSFPNLTDFAHNQSDFENINTNLPQKSLVHHSSSFQELQGGAR